jgi:hypothetical protein
LVGTLTTFQKGQSEDEKRKAHHADPQNIAKFP